MINKIKEFIKVISGVISDDCRLVMKKIKEFIKVINNLLSDDYQLRLLLFRIFLVHSVILIIFVLLFCIIGYEETFQITAKAHLSLIDYCRQKIVFVKYLFTKDFIEELRILFIESLFDASSDPMMLVLFVMTIFFLFVLLNHKGPY